MLGDNPDALYYSAPVRDDRDVPGDRQHRRRVYLSFTIEKGTAEAATARRPRACCATPTSTSRPTAASRSSSAVRRAPRNWLALPDGASEIIVRCYFENAEPAAADPNRRVPLTIEPLDADRPARAVGRRARSRRAWRRVAAFLRNRTLEQPKPGEREQPSWVSTTPNVFPPPELPGRLRVRRVRRRVLDGAVRARARRSARDHRPLARCRFANVSLWNRYLQTYDYAHRPASRNRANTRSSPTAAFRIVIAHEDPGAPNWIDTEGPSRSAWSSGGSSCPKATSRRRRPVVNVWRTLRG